MHESLPTQTTLTRRARRGRVAGVGAGNAAASVVGKRLEPLLRRLAPHLMRDDAAAHGGGGGRGGGGGGGGSATEVAHPTREGPIRTLPDLLQWLFELVRCCGAPAGGGCIVESVYPVYVRAFSPCCLPASNV